MIYTIILHDDGNILHDEEGYPIELEEVAEIIRRRYRRLVIFEGSAYVFKVDSRRMEEVESYLKSLDGIVYNIE